MATITDLTGSDITASENTSVQVGEDSNVNVFEFGNLILADVFPTLVWLLNFVSDMFGELVTVTDSNGNSIDVSDLSDSQLSALDESGISLSVADNTGSLVAVSDSGVTFSVDSNVNVFEFANLILADVFPTVLWVVGQVLDCIGSQLSMSDKSQDNAIDYDSTLHIYDEDLISYLGYTPEGYSTSITGSLSTLVDISGS
jgi:hypothetical protein